jgi:hypothetical protein
MKIISKESQPSINQYQLEEIKLYLDVYKHHFDLFGKGTLAYFTIIGVLCSYLFRSDISFWAKEFLAIFVVVFSLFCAVTCVVGYQWVLTVEHRVKILGSELGMAAFPFSGSKRIVIMVLLASSTLIISAILLIIGIAKGII